MATLPNSMLLAATLSEADRPTFTGLVITKKGVVCGRGADKKVYGDDKVHVVVVTGFSYTRLIERSLKMLETFTPADLFDLAQGQDGGLPTGFEGRGKAATERTLTLADFEEAFTSVKESLEKSYVGENKSTTDHVYDPLVVDGEVVRGGRVYKCVKGEAGEGGKPRQCRCQDCNPEDARAPIPGTIYLQGLFISQKVLVPAPNGPKPAPKSACLTVAKDFIRGLLPVARYVTYVLAPPARTGVEWTLKAGGSAMLAATEAGIHFHPEVKAALAKIKLAPSAA